jgi:hypothetical protein
MAEEVLILRERAKISRATYFVYPNKWMILPKENCLLNIFLLYREENTQADVPFLIKVLFLSLTVFIEDEFYLCILK